MTHICFMAREMIHLEKFLELFREPRIETRITQID
jgi:hypothetical protein